MKTIPNEVLAVLDAAEKTEHGVRLVGQLDRKLYAAVNKVLEAAGGKWNRSAKAHVFAGNAAEILEPIILTGEYATPKQDFQQFDTPREIAQMVFDAAEIRDGMAVLEPSVGLGRLLVPIVDAGLTIELDCIEVDQNRLFAVHDVSRLVRGTSRVDGVDFLRHNPRPMYDRVIMNPPFTRGQDIAHVRHAYDFLKPGGRLVAIMSPGFTFRQDQKYQAFREWLNDHDLGSRGDYTPLPDNAFKESGTNVSTVLVVIDKPS